MCYSACDENDITFAADQFKYDSSKTKSISMQFEFIGSVVNPTDWP